MNYTAMTHTIKNEEENRMKKGEMKGMTGMREDIQRGIGRLRQELFWKKDEGIDGILVTVGLCIIALLLCVVMKDSLSDFITTLVSSMTSKATTILNGTVSSGTILL